MTSKPSISSMTALCCLIVALFCTIRGSMGFLHCKSLSRFSSFEEYACRRNDQQHYRSMGVTATTMVSKDGDSFNDLHQQSKTMNRRTLLSSTLMGFSLALTTMTINSNPALARDEIFKSNPLTNPILEQVSLNLLFEVHS